MDSEKVDFALNLNFLDTQEIVIASMDERKGKRCKTKLKFLSRVSFFPLPKKSNE